jgi:hypothetical protein
MAPPDLVGMNELPGLWLVGYGMLLFLINFIIFDFFFFFFSLAFQNNIVFFLFKIIILLLYLEGLDSQGEMRGFTHVYACPKIEVQLCVSSSLCCHTKPTNQILIIGCS